MAKTTASASGVRYFAGPVRNTTETKTIQMQQGGERTPGRRSAARRRESRAGSVFPVRGCGECFRSFHGGVVHQNADRQREAAQRHHVDGVVQQVKNDNDVRIESGIEIQTINVLRQLPRRAGSWWAVGSRGDHPFFMTPWMLAARTLSLVFYSYVISKPGRRRRRYAGRTSIRFTISRVEAPPFFKIVSKVGNDCRPCGQYWSGPRIRRARGLRHECKPSSRSPA